MPPAVSISNRLLGGLSPEDLDLLRPHLEAVPLPHKQTLTQGNAPIDHVHFVQEGMVSLVQPLDNGAMIEVGMIGNEDGRKQLASVYNSSSDERVKHAILQGFMMSGSRDLLLNVGSDPEAVFAS